MTHAWLITGPPGAGRATAGRALAAALQCQAAEPGCGRCPACRQVLDDTHPDVEVVATERVHILIQEVAQLIELSMRTPSSGRWRVILVEDADRMLEATSNVLLKAIEEPPASTVWILCTPSSRDVLPTIRSRCRPLTLTVPSPRAVAELLSADEGIPYEQALAAARNAQCHIGVARYLATHPAARERRRQMIEAPVRARNVAEAVTAAASLVDIAVQDAKESTEELNLRERAELLRELGAAEDQPLDRGLRAQLRQLEEAQKGRATRRQRDVLDRALVDLLSLYRDVYVAQTGASVEPVNSDMTELIDRLARESTPAHSTHCMDAIACARSRLAANVAPLLALEAMVLSLRQQQIGGSR